jgi:predicted AAA+ superfamily ATPase
LFGFNLADTGREIPQLGISIPARTLRRFWLMLGNYNAQIVNFPELARSLGISDRMNLNIWERISNLITSILRD